MNKIINSETFQEQILQLLDHLYASQKENLEKMAQAFASCIANQGVIHVFGSGHSVGLGLDIKDRIGSLVPIHIMDMNDFVFKGGISLEQFKDKKNIFERRAGVAQQLYHLYDIRPQDIFIVISNSGINGIVIDIAQLAREHGHTVIVVTSMQHTLAEESRHPSGKKLYELGNIVVDNCGPHGDALLETDGIARLCSVSSICNNIIAQSTAARACEILIEQGEDVPILTENEQKNEALKKKYEGRI